MKTRRKTRLQNFTFGRNDSFELHAIATGGADWHGIVREGGGRRRGRMRKRKEEMDRKKKRGRERDRRERGRESKGERERRPTAAWGCEAAFW